MLGSISKNQNINKNPKKRNLMVHNKFFEEKIDLMVLPLGYMGKQLDFHYE